MDKHWIATVLLAGACALPVVAAPPAEPNGRPDMPPRHDGGFPPPPPPREGRRRPPEHEPGRRFRNGPGLWLVFSLLTPEERAEMQKLQREDPEKFREVMSAKADELYRKRRERRAALQQLAEQCRKAATPEERERLKKQLTEEVGKDFRAHLKTNRAQLNDMKRRTEWLEKELERREKNMDKAVSAQVEAMIKGEKPPRRPDSRRFNREPLEK